MQKSAVTDTRIWDSVIELQNTVKTYEQKQVISLFKRQRVQVNALNDVSFCLQKGDFCAYAGPNGAGKSTTFKLLSGMLTPTSGQVRVFGKDPTQERIPLMKRTGILFGNRSELWWDHPVSASFQWKKVVWDIDERIYQRNVERLTALLDLDDFWHAFARELSLGQRMRANLALTLLHSPELVLLDEPTLGLDVLAKRQMIACLKQLNREEGVTILVTSHDLDDLREMTRRIVLINQGKLAFDGGYEELLHITGDRRVLRLRCEGQPPASLAGIPLVSVEDGLCSYEYDACSISTERLFTALSTIKSASDIELTNSPIESVFAELYQRWRS
ncbi:MAG: ATP-binding cassette domain-containing protein [Eubacteriales bacterium]|nr:ATP-binding cassette domain-containing protein [Eubacteriales bacterium]